MKRLRILIASLMFLAMTLTLLGVARIHFPFHLQLIPAIISGSVLAVAGVIIWTLLTGRTYCSVICPLGIWQDLIWMLSRRLRRRHGEAVLWTPGRRLQTAIRWTVLALVILSVITGVGRLLVYLDPYSAFGRMVSQLTHLGLTADNRDNTVSGLNLTLVIIAIVTAVVTAGCAVLGGRLYCNTLCPVGTALGLLSRYSLLRVHIDADRCIRCGRCARDCKSACIDLSGDKPRVHTDLCVGCFDCVGACPKGALTYSKVRKGASINKDTNDAAAPDQEPATSETVDESRRRFLTTTATALASVPLLEAQRVTFQTTSGERWEKKIHTTMPDGRPAADRFWAIMPPATVSRDRFLAHCTSCQLCVSQCPEHILKPAVREYGMEGFMAPTVSFENGYCRPDCNRCAEVCPTDAIRLLPPAQKRKDKLGWANFNSLHCVTQTDNVECGICARRCPHRAITLVEKNGHKVPRVNVALCTGCGACEYYCPSRPKAIYVEGLMY